MPTRPFSRRTFLHTAALTAAATQLPSCRAAVAATTIVKTPSGTLRGEQNGDIRIFRGIPFAEPPTGGLRFRPPAAVKPWQGERDATRFGPAPFQDGLPSIPKSEDCLQLNVWAPAASPQPAKALPVFVWIHGGGFTGGYAFDPVSDGSQFAREGILCVTVAYRLGVFGFLDVEPMLGPDFQGSANNALRDLVLALHWIQDNIASFGGDPTRVTIGGESAGAKLCDILMGTPAATPLFHAVISESGGAERVWSRRDSLSVSQGFQKTWQALSPADAASLRTAEPAKLIEAQQRFIQTWPQHFPLRCEIDGILLDRPPIQNIASGSSRGKRLLLGSNRDESALFLGPHPSKDATAADLGNLPLPQFDTVYEKYAALYPDLSPEQRRIRAVTAEEYWVPSMRVAEAHARNGGPTWCYRLDFAETSGRLKGYAFHSLDVGLIWDKPHTDVQNAASEAALASEMHTAWAAFIRGDSPSSPGLPAWPEWNISDRKTMLFDTTSRVEAHPQQAELRLWDGLL